MNKKSGILAILLSLAISGSAQANVLTWFGALISVNVMQYALPYANLYFNVQTYRDVRDIKHKVGDLAYRAQRIQEQLNTVDGKVTNVESKVSALDGKVTHGFADLNRKVSGLQDALGETNQRIDQVSQVVTAANGRLIELQSQCQGDMQSLNANIEARFNGLSEQISANELKRQKDTDNLQAQGADTFSVVKGLEERIGIFEQVAGNAMSELATIKSLLQKVVEKKTEQEKQ